MINEHVNNYYVKEQIDYTTSNATRKGWRSRYDFAFQYIKKTDTVLDLACGLGENTYMIAQQCMKAVGADIDSDFIMYCKEKWPKIEFYNLDVTSDLPFMDNYFDVVVSIETLEHLPTMSSVKRALSNFKRVLKPGGKFVASVPNRKIAGQIPLLTLTKIWLRRMLMPVIDQQPNWHSHYRHMTPENFYRLLCIYFENVSVFGQTSGAIDEDLSEAPYLIAIST